MKLEIERKFLVNGDFKKYATHKKLISQGFLSTVPERTVRIRVADNKGYLTIKGKSNQEGTSRLEWEREIPFEEASALLKICEPTVISKCRYIVPLAGGLFYEVDEFFNENRGLLIAEIELEHEAVQFEKPDWLGKEITGISKYYNSMLSKNPYCNW